MRSLGKQALPWTSTTEASSSNRACRVSGLGFRISIFSFWFSCPVFGIQSPGCAGFRVPSSEFRFSVFAFRFQNLGFRVKGAPQSGLPLAPLCKMLVNLTVQSHSGCAHMGRVPRSSILCTNVQPLPSVPDYESCTDRNSYQFKNNCFTERRNDSEEGSHLRLIHFCITQL